MCWMVVSARSVEHMVRSFNLDAQILWTYFWVSMVAREEPRMLNATRVVARRMVRLMDRETSDWSKEEERVVCGVNKESAAEKGKRGRCEQ
jgi:hypothetical protein